VGSFYARFRGKEDLLAYLQQRIRDSALEGWREARVREEPSSASLSEAVGGAVDRLLEVRTRWDATLLAAAGLAESRADYAAFRRMVVEELAAQLLERGAEITHATPEVAVRVGLWAALGVIDRGGSDVPPAVLDGDALRRECTALLVAYLAGHAPEPGSQVDFFDVWS
jgi:AcrR family transcriptional regulator